MKCPKCTGEMEDITIEHVKIKRCTLCKGMWFERGILEYFEDYDDVATVDIGDEEVGKSMNEKSHINCPDCNAPMLRMVVADQHHIWYESCSKCFSTYFDAGELRDYLKKDLLDFFKDLITPERT
jgi:Zn-finger nucleic acid-binding protein